MPFLILPKVAKEISALENFDGAKIEYEVYKNWRNAHVFRNVLHGEKDGMNFREEQISTLFKKTTFIDLLSQKDAQYTHIGIFFGSQQGVANTGVGNFRELTAFLTLAIKQVDNTIMPFGKVYRGGKDNKPFDNMNLLNRFKEQYKVRINDLRQFSDAAIDYSAKETTGVYHEINSISTEFLNNINEDIKVIFVKDPDKYNVPRF